MNYRARLDRRLQRADFRRFNQDAQDDEEDENARLPRETLLDRQNPLESLSSSKFRWELLHQDEKKML